VNKLKILKSTKKILIATNNPGKFKEIKELLPKKIRYFKPKDFNMKEPVENGKTFQANAKIKSLYGAKSSKIVCISDDSGIEISELNNQPGIYSARWAGRKKNFNSAIQKVYKKLKKKNKLNSKANFVCCLSIALPDGTSREFIGRIKGRIVFPAKGKNGFGYDPIFIPHGQKKTFGELKKREKQKISHRYEAFKKIKKYFKFS
tara:strand:- start:70357 stop:70968 length:612 start_codon:yes stop_codon:yes gene_type:complete